MKKYLLPSSGNFYKAAMHVHTDISDGRESVENMTEAYKSKGYSVIAYTDHEVFVTHNDLSNENFLAINAVELAVNNPKWSKGGWDYLPTYHLNFYARHADIDYFSACTESSIYVPRSHAYMTERMKQNVFPKSYSTEAINRMIAAGNADGFLVCYNHPSGSLQNYPDYIGLKGLWSAEWFNYGSYLGGMFESMRPIEDFLHVGEHVMPIVGDDSHSIENVGHCFTMIKSPDLQYDNVMTALEKGDFYSSTGPEIHELYIEDGILHITCSEVVRLYVTTERRVHFCKESTYDTPFTSAEFDLNNYHDKSSLFDNYYENAYFRVTLFDEHGREANSRAYYLNEAF